MRTELTVAVDINRRDRSALVHSVNASNKGGCLDLADADGAGFASNTLIADIDIQIARGETGTGEVA